jgi:N-acetylglutamate synthase-like GNAT family acetyltransferase
LEESEFIRLLTEVGFEKPSIEPTRIYEAEDAAAFLANTGVDAGQFAEEIGGRFMGAFVRATKPGLSPLGRLPAMQECAGALLRRAMPSDEPAVAALLTAAALPLDGVHEALRCFVVAEDAGAIVGVAGIEECGTAGEHALLRSVAVAPAWRNRGLGRVLVTRAIAEAEARGVRALYLLTTTAEGYFPGFGFTVTTRDAAPDDVRATAEFRGACPASAAVMMLALAGDAASVGRSARAPAHEITATPSVDEPTEPPTPLNA